MKRKKREAIYESACKAYGLQDRMFKAIEEMGELQAAISRYIAGTDGHDYWENNDNLIEEIADASIMMEQLVYIFDDLTTKSGLTYKQVRNEKLHRLSALTRKKMESVAV